MGNGALASVISLELSSNAGWERILLGDAVARRHVNVPPNIRIHRFRHPRRSDLPSSDSILDVGVRQRSHMGAVETAADTTGDGTGGDLIFSGPILLGPPFFEP